MPTAIDDTKRFLYLYPQVKTADDPIELLRALVKEAVEYHERIIALEKQLRLVQQVVAEKR